MPPKIVIKHRTPAAPEIPAAPAAGEARAIPAASEAPEAPVYEQPVAPLSPSSQEKMGELSPKSAHRYGLVKDLIAKRKYRPKWKNADTKKPNQRIEIGPTLLAQVLEQRDEYRRANTVWTEESRVLHDTLEAERKEFNRVQGLYMALREAFRKYVEENPKGPEIDCEALKGAYDHLMELYLETHRSHESLNAMYHEMLQEYNAATAQVKNLEGKIKGLEDTYNQLSKAFIEVSNQLDGSNINPILNTDCDALRKDYETLKAQYAELQREAADKESKLKECQENGAIKAATLQEWEEEREQTLQRIEDLTAIIAQNDEEIKRLRQEESSQQTQDPGPTGITIYTEREQNMAAELSRVSQTLTEAQAELERVTQSRDQAISRIHEHLAELEQTRENLEAATKQATGYKETLEQTRRDLEAATVKVTRYEEALGQKMSDAYDAGRQDLIKQARVFGTKPVRDTIDKHYRWKLGDATYALGVAETNYQNTLAELEQLQDKMANINAAIEFDEADGHVTDKDLRVGLWDITQKIEAIFSQGRFYSFDDPVDPSSGYAQTNPFVGPDAEKAHLVKQMFLEKGGTLDTVSIPDRKLRVRAKFMELLYEKILSDESLGVTGAAEREELEEGLNTFQNFLQGHKINPHAVNKWREVTFHVMNLCQPAIEHAGVQSDDIYRAFEVIISPSATKYHREALLSRIRDVVERAYSLRRRLYGARGFFEVRMPREGDSVTENGHWVRESHVEGQMDLTSPGRLATGDEIAYALNPAIVKRDGGEEAIVVAKAQVVVRSESRIPRKRKRGYSWFGPDTDHQRGKRLQLGWGGWISRWKPEIDSLKYSI